MEAREYENDRSRSERAVGDAGGAAVKRRPVLPAVPALALVLILAMFAAALAGCGPEVGATETIQVDEPLASAAVTDVELVMGAGTLTLGPGAPGLAAGTIRCNVADWLPQIRRSDSRLLIQQKSRDNVSSTAVRTTNDWDLLLGGSPMRLKITAGAYEADLDLSGLTLQGLSIEEGAAKTLVMFNTPNPGQMDRLSYKTGASEVSLSGLANANFRAMEFSGGAGSYSFDFSGQLRTTATVKVEVGTGTVRVEVPASTAATVRVSGSQTVVDTQGAWVTKGSTHSTPAAGSGAGGKVLTIEVEMSTGTATLIVK